MLGEANVSYRSRVREGMRILKYTALRHRSTRIDHPRDAQSHDTHPHTRMHNHQLLSLALRPHQPARLPAHPPRILQPLRPRQQIRTPRIRHHPPDAHAPAPPHQLPRDDHARGRKLILRQHRGPTRIPPRLTRHQHQIRLRRPGGAGPAPDPEIANPRVDPPDPEALGVGPALGHKPPLVRGDGRVPKGVELGEGAVLCTRADPQRCVAERWRGVRNAEHGVGRLARNVCVWREAMNGSLRGRESPRRVDGCPSKLIWHRPFR